MKHILLKALCGIKNELVFASRGIEVTGICNLVEDYLAYAIYSDEINPAILNYTLKRLFKSWPNFSGNSHYPVPSSNPIYTAGVYYALCDDYWDEATEYGRNRIDLLDWCINSLYMELYGL